MINKATKIRRTEHSLEEADFEGHKSEVLLEVMEGHGSHLFEMVLNILEN